jgi:transposase
VISGILHMLRLGCCWRDCPPEYGPATTIYNRCAAQGVWKRIFERLAAAEHPGRDLDRQHACEGASLGSGS